MSFRAAGTPVIRLASRLALLVPVIALGTLLLLPSIDDASAQGYRSYGGGYSGGGSSMPSRGMSSKSSGPWSKAGPRPRPSGSNAGNSSYPNSSYPKGGMRGTGTAGNNSYPYPTGGMRGTGHPRPTGGTADNRYPKGDRYYPPRRHWRPIVVPTAVVAVPGPTYPGPTYPGPTYAAPSSGGGSPPPSAQPAPRPAAPAPQVNWGRYVPNEVVVEVSSGLPPQAMNAILQRHRLTQLEVVNLQFSGTSIRRLRINDRRSVPAVVRALAAEGVVAQPNLIASLQDARSEPADATALEQYALDRMRMPEAHKLATGNRVLIAVIDSGVDMQHPELAGMILDTFDAIGTGDAVHAHGTSIVGAIVARARLRGTAPGAQILLARAFGTNRANMDGTTTDIIKAIEWAVQRGARIINMSFAGGRDPAIERRLNTARGRGIILVAAAGNAGPNSPPLYPAAIPVVIAVTATDDADRIFRLANRGNHIAVAAPGVDLLLPTLGGDYRMISGTSFSAAEVTGIVALMLERNPGLSHDAVRRALVSTAQDLGTPGIDPLFGAGIVDAYRALMAVVPAAPSADATPTTTGAGNQ